MTARPHALLLALAGALLAASCSSVTNVRDELSLTGDWCTLRALGADGLPVDEAAWVGGQWNQEESEVAGTGSVKRADDDELWPSRFRGNVVGEQLLMEVTPLGEAQEGAPFLELDLRIEGRNDLVGTVSGDAGIQGEITLVRLGSRCFAN